MKHKWKSIVEDLFQDIHYGLRQVRRAPGFAALAVLTLAVGIGANSAVFNVILALELENLPVPAPQELVWLRGPHVSYPVFQEVQARGGDVFTNLFVWALGRFPVDWAAGCQSADVLMVSGGFFETLGVAARLGRTFGPADDVQGGGRDGHVAVITDACRKCRFSSGPAAIGKTVRIYGVAFTAVGVMPEGFFGVAPGTAPEIIIPIAAVPDIQPQKADILRAPMNSWLYFMGRLKPGITREAANSRIQAFWPNVLEAMVAPGELARHRLAYLSKTVDLIDGRTGFSPARNQFSRTLRLLFALVGVLLLLACATVSNLLLARASGREPEIATRTALGASRGRLIRQFLTEGLLLAGLGGALALAFAKWSGTLLIALLSAGGRMVDLNLSPRGPTLAFTGAAIVASALLFGIAPTIRAINLDSQSTLRGSNRVVAPSGWAWASKALVIGQVALSLVLLTGASLFAFSLHHLLALDPGFDRGNVLLASPDPLSAGYSEDRLHRFYSRLIEDIQALPGVASASLASLPPVSYDIGDINRTVIVDDGPAFQQGEIWTATILVSPGYFHTLGIPLLAGREFEAEDNRAGSKVVIVNQSFARTCFGADSALGRRISLGGAAEHRKLQIVGIVQDAKYRRIQEPNRPIAYVPYALLPALLKNWNLLVAVRTSAPLAPMAQAILLRMRDIDKTVTVQVESLSDRIGRSLVTERVIALLASLLGTLALILASGGVYGVVAYTVAGRTSEIAVRMALGAQTGDILWMVLRQTIRLAAAGIILGLAASLALGSMVAAMLYGIVPADPGALACAATLQLNTTT